MNKILKKTYFSEKVVQMVVEAPLIAKSRKPGPAPHGSDINIRKRTASMKKANGCR